MPKVQKRGGMLQGHLAWKQGGRVIFVKYIQATGKDTEKIVKLVLDTIVTIYPKYYPKEIVDFFCEHHCRGNIEKDIELGTVGILINDGVAVGTGCYSHNHITRVYVAPAFQKQGYGSYIMQCLEDEIGLKYDKVNLDASLPASCLYESMGYRTIKHEKWPVKNNVIVVYEIMEKVLKKH